MPALQPGSKILVTGASGFIAAHIVREFLAQGFNVRGTVRDDAKGEYLTDLFKDSKSSFEYVIVKDIAEAGAFDEAVKGVDGVAHVASPVTFVVEKLEDVAIPAVNGTLGVLKSIKAHGPSVQRVVYTASSASINGPGGPPTHYTEKDWNTVDLIRCEKLGDAAPGDSKYRVSKTMAEKAFWEFIKTEKPAFDGATIHPPMVYGPIIHQCDSPEKLNMSVRNRIYPYAAGKMKQSDLPESGSNFADVRDVAMAQVRAMTVPEAGGERFIVSNGPYSGNDVCVVLNRDFPDLPNVPTGNTTPGFRESLNITSNFVDGAKARRLLGISYHGIEDTVRDTVQSLRERFAF
ncbi:low-affinity phosphate transporter [Cryptotrichosporon argae]